jgi:hypothetical protein
LIKLLEIGVLPAVRRPLVAHLKVGLNSARLLVVSSEQLVACYSTAIFSMSP